MAAARKDSVAVFFDYENTHRTGHGQYAAYGTPVHETAFNPVTLGVRIVAKRRRSSQLTDIRVYRGRPVPEHQPTPASAFDIQARAWSVDSRVTLRTRDLTYRFPYTDPNQFLVQEKGIDVSLAIDLVEAAMLGKYDAMIVFSCDTDLLPAVELVRKIARVHIEIACWNGANPLWLREGLRKDPKEHFPYCHFLNEDDFTASRETSASHLS